MSFASDVKTELCKEKMNHPGEILAEAYGILLFCNLFTPTKIRITTQNQSFSQRLPRLFRKAFQIRFDVFPREETPSGKMRFEITSAESIRKILDVYGYAPENIISHHINYAVLEDESSRAAFLRGAFLAGGSTTDPEKRYHLELATSHLHVHRELQALLQEMGFEAKEITRKSNYVSYLKRSETIADLLTTLGAPLAAMELMNAKVEKNLRNGVNRWSNCDFANVSKSVDAAQSQIDAIRKLQLSGELEKLTVTLQETARLRIENPELSLTQLAQLAQISKSCLNHRLRKLVELSRESGEQGASEDE